MATEEEKESDGVNMALPAELDSSPWLQMRIMSIVLGRHREAR